MKLDVVIEELFPHPIGAVWGALTDPASISEWLMATTGFEPRVGARFTMKTRNLAADGWVRAEVLELEPPRRMVWAWAHDDVSKPTTVVFELVPEGEGTRLTLTHEGVIDPATGSLLTDGWPGRLALLGRSLG